MAWMKRIIDRAILRNNYKKIKKILGEDVHVGAVVKSDAYGHGIVECAKTFLKEGASFLIVSLIDEGIILRENGIFSPVLLIGGIWPEESEECIAHDLIPVISEPSMLSNLSLAACKLQKPAKIHIKVDTGMGRLGVLPDGLSELLEKAARLPGIEIDGLMSHFSVADSEEEEDKEYTKWQMEKFKQIADCVREKIPSIRWIHLANSAGALKYKDARWNLVRLGLSLYGGVKEYKLILKEAIEVTSKIIHIKDVPKGKYISYGRSYRTKKDTKVAVVPVGYASGYLRCFSNKGKMIIKGKRAPVLGRVCMDLTLVDITSIPEAKIGDKVTILGEQDGERISVFELSEWAGTIPYEIFCLLGGAGNAKREYIN